MNCFRVYCITALVASCIIGGPITGSLFGENTHTLSDKEFLGIYCQTIARSQEKLTKMHKGGLEAYGTETIEGDISGTCTYTTSIYEVFKIKVAVTYSNYRDYDIILNGTQIIIVNWLSNGFFIGTVYVSGKYKGHVRYDLDIQKGTSSGRYYHVKHSTDRETRISYLAVQEYFADVRKNIDPDQRGAGKRQAKK